MQPIDVSASPLSIPSFSLTAGMVDLHSVLVVLITLVFIWWAVFTLVALYHWFRYGRESWVAVPAMALHFLVSGWIFIFATGGFH